jgi:hypothetical protein
VNIVRWPSYGAVTTTFHLYTLTVDCPNNVVIAYADGAPCQTNTINLPWLHVYGHKDQHWLCIGALAHDGTPQWGDDKYPNAGYMSGKMDDIRIYNRTLSPGEVRNLYYGSGMGSLKQTDPTISQTVTQSVEICWSSQTSIAYQVEFQSVLNSNAWLALGSAVVGTGGDYCVTDSMAGYSRKFYRVRPLP